MKTGRAWRVFLAGLVLSVLFHLGLLSGHWMTRPAWIRVAEVAPIEARLLPPPLLVPDKPVQKAAPQPFKPFLPEPAPVVVAESATLPGAFEDTTETAVVEPPPTPDPIVAPAFEPAPPPPAAPDEVPAQVATAHPLIPLNRLPRRATLEYRARYGLAAGKQTLLWVNEGERYTLTSVATASGLASLVFSGKMVQTSRGRLTDTGLQPEAFWDQRGSKRSLARFDHAAHTIVIEGHRGVRTLPLPDDLQDAQSLLFQIALTGPPATESAYAVFNGKKVRTYRYRVTGEETLDTPLGTLRAVRIVRVTDVGAERFEVWLAVDRYYLPLKLATEISGYDAELTLQKMLIED